MLNRRLLWIVLLIFTLVLVGCEEDLAAPPIVTNPTATPNTGSTGGDSSTVRTIALGNGYGAERAFWQVYFNAPTGSSDASTYTGAMDEVLAAAIDGVQATLDIAAFEMNNRPITDAIIRAHRRGVRVRMVVDNEHGITVNAQNREDFEDTTLWEILDAGVPIVDDDRSGLMHNKFMILDSTVVWTGSWNYTINGSYRNNNNALVLRSRRAVESYQGEFDEMWANGEGGQFGSTSPGGNSVSYTQDGVSVQILFAAEDDVEGEIIRRIQGATSQIRIMSFALTLDNIGDALLERMDAGVAVSGVFDSAQATTRFAEGPRLLCAGADIRIDGNPYKLHHKVIIIDNHTVITGSFNFSSNASTSNDENVIIITDPTLAAQYIAEFDRLMAQGTAPGDRVTC